MLKRGGRTVYFGNIGPNSQEVIGYFERNNAIQCKPDDNPAEYILQVIGAGATAKVDRDWADAWESTPDARKAVEETKALKVEYKELAGEDQHEQFEGTFAAPWYTQYKAVQLRIFQIYYRNPGYITSKVTLNVVTGLFLGFTFYQEDTSVQGMQDKACVFPI